MANIQVLKNNLSSAFEIQQCTVGSFSLIERIPGFQCVFASYVSIECSERNSENSRFRILNRLSRGRTIVDGVPVLNCSFRVMELIVSPEFSYGDDYQTRFELTLAKEINRMRPGINELFGQKRDLITSIDRIRLLKSGPIKLIRITVITSTYPPASCSRYPSTSRDRNDDENNSSYFNIFSEIIKTILQTYDIRLKTRVLVDLRNCSLAKSFYCEEERSEILSPEFIFVDECQMKHSTNSDRNNLTEIGIGRVNSQTQILIERVHHVDYYSRLLQSLKQDNSPFHFAGVERVFEKLKEIVEIQMCSKRENLCGSVKVSQGLLVAGPQGSGKSRAICEAAKVLQANLLVFKVATSKIPIVSNNDNSRQRTTSYFSRMNSLNEIFSKAIASGNMYPTILLIEGLELLHYNRQSDMTAGKKQKNQSSVQKEKLVNNICHLFDFVPSDCLLTIVATTSKPHLTPTHLRIFPRLQQEITINIPVESVRVKILKSLTNGNHAFEAIDLNSIAKRTPGFVGADLMRLVHRTFQKMRDEECNSVSEFHIKYALAHVFPSALQGSIGLVDIQRVTSLDHIVGLEQVKLNLIKAIVWPLLFPHAFFTMGIQPSKGILLYGPPGCGKTTLVRALAASHQTNFLSVSAAELFSSGVGDSEKIVSHLFHRARMASPCILFLDELGSFILN